jgi:hypothetical protein
MISSAIVTIVLNGAIVPSFAPARIVGGRVVGPLMPVVARMCARVRYQDGDHTVVIDRGGRDLAVPVAFVADGVPYVALVPIVRAFGGTAEFDPQAKTLAIALADDLPVQTPAPFDPTAPQVAPTTIFTPEPSPPAPRATLPGNAVPVPRRTAIPATPSQPSNDL